MSKRETQAQLDVRLENVHRARVALAEAAAFLGLVMFILSASRLVYVVGAVIAFAGMLDAAPSGRRLAGLQKKADAEGGGLDVLAALQQGGLSH